MNNFGLFHFPMWIKSNAWLVLKFIPDKFNHFANQ